MCQTNIIRMKKIIIGALVVFLGMQFSVMAQKNYYHAQADAGKEIIEAVEQAKMENKHVLVQIGGNWCPWCIRLEEFCKNTPVVDSLLKVDFIKVKVSYSKENRNSDILKQLEYPQRFGFPVLVVLDGNGKRIHTQNSAYLEEQKSYSSKKISEFLRNWNFNALRSENYK